jgi:hypothetical protein
MVGFNVEQFSCCSGVSMVEQEASSDGLIHGNIVSQPAANYTVRSVWVVDADLCMQTTLHHSVIGNDVCKPDRDV